MEHKYQPLLGDQHSLDSILRFSRKEGGRAWESQEVVRWEDLGVHIWENSKRNFTPLEEA